ncbi:ImmA/IrrE family metallo-endopeptidase [Bradyrhizobium japonicum]|uniref:ImmA/IrrE family metallo-endopeptidase n=1 Tax=Bradyrhizobium japonicum TaxID=375 RepID=UPI00048183B3|nr:ImmA/IrrE family metallo-endopeptidase [Bradyrhizobium japonicum]
MDDEEHDDRRVTRRSNDECRRIANDTKSYYGIERLRPVNIGRILRSGKVLTLRGERPLIYECVDDQVLGTKDARTELVGGAVKITIKRSIDIQSSWGDGRSRMTMAHELGHAVMHAADGFIDHRASGAAGTTTLSKLSAAESAEHQAKVFASAFLIHDRQAAELAAPIDIATEFLVSMTAAELCFERLQAEQERVAAVARVVEANRAFQALMRASEKKRKRDYLQSLCPQCQARTLFPLGTQIGCDNCGYTGKDPEKGDS